MAARFVIEEDFYLQQASVVGIISELPDYRLCYMLNQDLGFRLTRSKQDRELFDKKGNFFYSEYEFADNIHQVDWYLTANKKCRRLIGGEAGTDTAEFENSIMPLVADLKLFDYFLWYSGDNNPALDDFLRLSLQKPSYVRTFSKINTEQSKHIRNLLLEY